MIFTQPWGLLGLLGLPVLVWIYLYQRRGPTAPTNLFFLLPDAGTDATGGRKRLPFQSTPSFWLYAAAILLATLLLTGPVWIGQRATQRVAVVVDESFSMAAFRPETEAALAEIGKTLAARSRHTDFLVLGSHPSANVFYRGTEAGALAGSLPESWPARNGHDPLVALTAARAAAGTDGVVVWLTDHPEIEGLDDSVTVVSVGQALENVGFAGVTFESGPPLGWQALVRNYGAQNRSLEWWTEVPGQADAAHQTLSLEAGATATLSGNFPATQRLVLHLSSDDFALDDALPLVRPQEKSLAVLLQTGDFDEPLRRMLDALGAIRETVGSPEVTFILGEQESDGPTVRFTRWPETVKGLWTEPTLSTDAALIRGLEWDALVIRQPPGAAPTPQGEVLVWKGERPLVERRGDELRLHFDPRFSNLARVPEFLVLLHRFVEEVRVETPGYEQSNHELSTPLTTAQALQWIVEPVGQPAQPVSALGQWPAVPSFIEGSREGRLQLLAAAHFADAREADFSAAALRDDLPTLMEARNRAVAHPITALNQFILLLIGLCLAGAWSMAFKRG
ncbi:MAG: hypothetical protein Q7P63_02830 [Verrucomicrobiota bacterium JB022]|nr:hypothetical protein [Verrucomicrobiota bacterium JB022]